MSSNNGHRDLASYEGGLVRDAAPWLVWARQDGYWRCVSGAATEGEAEQLRKELGAELALPRGRVPPQVRVEVNGRSQ